MIYSFKERNLIINHLIKEALDNELDIDIEFENFHLENLHDHFSSESKPKRAMLYFNRENKEEKLPSQKYQQLICLEYCQEKNITPVRLETVLSGFDYFPTLFHISEHCTDENFRDIVIFSKENLPDSIELKNKFFDIAKKNNLVVHYVFEDEIEEY